MTGTKTLFFDKAGRLRSGFRMAVFIAIFLFSTALLGYVSNVALSNIPIGFGPGSISFFVTSGLVSLVAALFAGWVCGRHLEGLPFRALGAWFSRRWFVHALLGLAFGLLTLSLAIGLGVLLGGLTFSPNAGQGRWAIFLTMGVSFAVFAIAAAFEEALFRGYILQTFARSGLILFGVILTSFMFATVHNANPNASVLSWINTFLAGIWFATSYIRTRDLWFVTGMHITWNWTQGAVFGVEVSGLKELIAAPMLSESDLGPVWLTGGSYGVEGGIVTTIALIVSTAAIYFLPILRPDEEILAMTSPPRYAIEPELQNA